MPEPIINRRSARMRRLLPDEPYEKMTDAPEAAQARVIADYIAGMTDRYALSEHQRLFSPPAPTV